MNSIEIAIKMEQDAIEYYAKAAEMTSHPVGKKMFLSIMEDEKRHLAINKCVLNQTKITAEEASPLKNIKTIFEQMKGQMLERVQATTDEMEALKTAMEMEKEGVEFYKKLASEAKNPKEKELFERLRKEEEQHYQVFSNTYFFMSDSGSWFMWEEHSIVDGGTPWA